MSGDVTVFMIKYVILCYRKQGLLSLNDNLPPFVAKSPPNMNSLKEQFMQI
jgi:hypothetical protein